MAKAVVMPRAGISVESCIITEWLKKPGDTVAEGEILFRYETDKASFECESTETGAILEIFYQDGDEVPVLVNVCAVGESGEDASALRPGGGSGAGAAATNVVAEAAALAAATGSADAEPAPASTGVTAAPISGEVNISPRAKSLAVKSHVDARLATGTGPYGRVIERDIRALMDSGASSTAAAYGEVLAVETGTLTGTGIGGKIGVADLAGMSGSADAVGVIGTVEVAEHEDVKFGGVRRAISASMTRSLATIPQLTHNFSFDASAILAYRRTLKESGEVMGVSGITLGDMILYAVSRLLPGYPDLNANMLDGTTIRRFRDVNLGFACDTERGLMVPVIRRANKKSLARISAEVKELAKRARSGALSPDNMSGGTFTVSNLGALGVESFTPVINPPETGILGVDNIVKRPRETDGAITLYPAMGLSLTYDHRAIDGAPASRFIQELCRVLEAFPLILSL